MDHEAKQPGEINELERELRALVPRAPKIEVARLMYMAGQASMSPVPPPAPVVAGSAWYWPLSTAISSVIAVWLSVMLIITNYNPSLSPIPRAGKPDTPKKKSPPVDPPQVVAVEKPAASGDREITMPVKNEIISPSLGTAVSTPGTYGSMTRSIIREEERRTGKKYTGAMWNWWGE